MAHRLNPARLAPLVTGLTLLLGPPAFATTQVRERTVKKIHALNEPVKISKLKLKGVERSFGRKFNDEDDWLRGLMLEVKNTSSKPIVYMEIDLDFPRPEGQPSPDSLPFGRPLRYGYGPVLHAPLPPDMQQLLLPGEEVEIRLTDSEYDSLAGTLRELRYPTVEEIELSVSIVIFGDDTGWSLGTPTRRHPEKPDRWINAERPGRIASFRKVASEHDAPGEVNFISAGYHLAEWTSPLRPAPAAPQPPAQESCYKYDYFERLNCAYSGCTVRRDYLQGFTYDTSYPTYYLVSRLEECSRIDGSTCYEPNAPTVKVYRQTSVRRLYLQVAAECPDQPPPDCSTVRLKREGQARFLKAGHRARPILPDDCCFQTPIVIDVLGDGFSFTGAEGGVSFDFNGDGVPHQISWTTAGSDDAWLVLDRDANGVIESGVKLFGNVTPQPRLSINPNGFLALNEYDKAAQGGNGDGVINSDDAIFPSLRLWQDVNHNGISEAGELHALTRSGVTALHLDYKESKRADEHGNRFRYRAKVEGMQGAKSARWAWDVFLITTR